MSSSRILSSFLLLAGAISRGAATTCYFPNGDMDSGSTPCNDSAEFSHCCAPQDLCLANGYCFTSGINDWGNRIARISCTDPQWQSKACPQYCADDFSAQGVTIAMAQDFSTGLFCCQASYNITSQSCGVSTQNSNEPFPLANAGVIFNRTSGSIGPNATVVGVAAATTVATVLAGKGGSSGASTGKEVGLGVGLGISLGVLLLITLGLLWRSIKHRKNLERQLKEYTRNNGTTTELGQQQVYEQKPAPQAYQPNSELEARSRAELEGR